MRRKEAGSTKPSTRKWSAVAIAAFCLSLALCLSLFAIMIQNKSSIERMSMEQLMMEKSVKINEVISKLLYKTQALSALVIQNNGEFGDFERVAATIMDDPAILNLVIAPNGVVSNVYPLQGNEPLIGFDLLGEGAGNKEALEAKEMNQLVFGGPFQLMQGGEALVGRLPVWVDAPDDRKRFWGLVSVTLKYPQALDGAGLDVLKAQGFAYEIWRVNPDNNERQIIANSEGMDTIHTRFIEQYMPILNADWYFRISPVRMWYEHPENWTLIFIGLCVSVLIGFIVQNNMELKAVKGELENMVCTDPLTELKNRKGLFHSLETLMERQERFQLYYIDLNHFKQINDTYGHNIGDYVLREFSKRIQKHLDQNFLCARISGDEFVIVHVGDQAIQGEVEYVWSNIYHELEAPIVRVGHEDVFLSFSRGMAAFPEDGQSLDELIHCADTKMYEQKRMEHAQN